MGLVPLRKSKAARVSEVLTGGFSVYAGVEIPY